MVVLGEHNLQVNNLIIYCGIPGEKVRRSEGHEVVGHPGIRGSIGIRWWRGIMSLM